MTLEIVRLKKRADFLRIAALQQKCVRDGFVLQMAPNPKTGEGAIAFARLGFTVSRKVGCAVERNRARRRLKEAARKIMPDYAQAGCDYVIIARKSALEMDFSEMVLQMQSAFKKLGHKL